MLFLEETYLEVELFDEDSSMVEMEILALSSAQIIEERRQEAASHKLPLNY